MRSKTLWAAITMFGGIIGAGVFGIPFVFSRAGVAVGLAYLAVIGTASVLANVFYAVTASETAGRHRLAGYARQHLGPRVSAGVAVIGIVEFFGAMVAYVILGGSFLSSIFGGQAAMWSVIFWAAVSLLIFLPLKRTEAVDHALSIVIIAVVAAMAAVVLPHVSLANMAGPEAKDWFAPYGVLLFALSGSAVVPEIVEMMRKKERQSLRAIAVGTMAAASLAGVFGALVVGACGAATTDNAIVSLAPLFGRPIVVLGSLFGLAAVTTQYVIVGANIRDEFHYDFKLPRLAGWSIAIIVPLAAFALGARDFVGLIGFMGATFGALVGITIVVMGWRLMRKSGKHGVLRFCAVPLIILFAIGIISEIIYVLR